MSWVLVLACSCKDSPLNVGKDIYMTDIDNPVELTAGDSIVLSGHFLNKSRSDYSIYNLSSGCKCTKMQILDSLLTAGKKTRFQVTFKSHSDDIGPQDILVFLSTREKRVRDTFSIRVNIKRKIEKRM
jgi:hypothetical protein